MTDKDAIKLLGIVLQQMDLMRKQLDTLTKAIALVQEHTKGK